LGTSEDNIHQVYKLLYYTAHTQQADLSIAVARYMLDSDCGSDFPRRAHSGRRQTKTMGIALAIDSTIATARKLHLQHKHDAQRWSTDSSGNDA